MFLFLVLVVLKNNYTTLCCCLPQDYMNTINKVKQLARVSESILNTFVNLPTTDLCNEFIIGYLMTGIKSDTDALQFCDNMEDLTEHKGVVEILRNGIFLKMISCLITVAT